MIVGPNRRSNPVCSIEVIFHGTAYRGEVVSAIIDKGDPAAGQKAGRLKDPGRMVVLMPIQRAYALVPDGA